MKELPSTLLLRPFNYDTLATNVYALASLERFEEAAFGALTIVALGLLPILMLHEAIARGRRGGKGQAGMRRNDVGTGRDANGSGRPSMS
jgi:iron(III) transport system permease protein